MIVEFLTIKPEFCQILISRTFCSGYFKFKISNLSILRFIHFTIDPINSTDYMKIFIYNKEQL
jgi:hypothetical protein